MIAAVLAAAEGNVQLVLLLAVVLFLVAGVLRILAKNIDATLVAFGLAAFAVAFLIDP